MYQAAFRQTTQRVTTRTREWGREHPDVPKITAATVNKQLTAVQAIANWARDNGMIPDEVQWADPFRRMRLGEDEAIRGGAPFELLTFR